MDRRTFLRLGASAAAAPTASLFPAYAALPGDATTIDAQELSGDHADRAINRAISTVAGQGGGSVFLPAGKFRISSSIVMDQRVSLVGQSTGTWLIGITPGMTMVRWSEAREFHLYSRIVALTLLSEVAHIGIDFSAASESWIEHTLVQLKGSDRVGLLGRGNNGSSPYYNKINGCHFAGDNLPQVGTTGSIGVLFMSGSLGAGSDGPNDNFFHQCRFTGLTYGFDFRSGNGNKVGAFSGESIYGAYVRLNERDPVASGTVRTPREPLTLSPGPATSGSSVQNGAVRLTSGKGKGQSRRIRGLQEGRLILEPGWSYQPEVGTRFEVYEAKAFGNAFAGPYRGEGGGGCDFVQFRPGAFRNTFGPPAIITSLGSGLLVRDSSGDPTNIWPGEAFQIDLSPTHWRGFESPPGEAMTMTMKAPSATPFTVRHAIATSASTPVTSEISIFLGRHEAFSGMLGGDAGDVLYVPAPASTVYPPFAEITARVSGWKLGNQPLSLRLVCHRV